MALAPRRMSCEISGSSSCVMIFSHLCTERFACGELRYRAPSAREWCNAATMGATSLGESLRISEKSIIKCGNEREVTAVSSPVQSFNILSPAASGCCRKTAITLSNTRTAVTSAGSRGKIVLLSTAVTDEISDELQAFHNGQRVERVYNRADKCDIVFFFFFCTHGYILLYSATTVQAFLAHARVYCQEQSGLTRFYRLEYPRRSSS